MMMAASTVTNWNEKSSQIIFRSYDESSTITIWNVKSSWIDFIAVQIVSKKVQIVSKKILVQEIKHISSSNQTKSLTTAAVAHTWYVMVYVVLEVVQIVSQKSENVY
jgi:hypothetical protein